MVYVIICLLLMTIVIYSFYCHQKKLAKERKQKVKITDMGELGCDVLCLIISYIALMRFVPTYASDMMYECPWLILNAICIGAVIQLIKDVSFLDPLTSSFKCLIISGFFAVVFCIAGVPQEAIRLFIPIVGGSAYWFMRTIVHQLVRKVGL